MIDVATVPVAEVSWRDAVRIIRSIHPPIDLFEDIADPADWPLLISAEQKTNPRLMESIGDLDLVPAGRRAAGPGAEHLMAPFTHVSADRPSRFSAGAFGVLYAGNSFEVALFETVHHHTKFMARTNEPAGWTSSSGRLCSLSMRGCMTCEAAIRTRPRSIRTTIRRAKPSALSFGSLDPMASSIRAFALKAGSASGFSIPTAPQT